MPTLTERLTDVSLVGAGVRRVRVTTPRGPLSMLRGEGRGDGPPIVLLHGLGSCAADLSALLRRLRRHTSLLLAPDLPGHGHSPAPDAAFEPDAVAAQLSEGVAAMLPGPALLFGSSLGGLAAVRFAQRHPARVIGLVLASPAGAPMSAEEHEAFFDSLRVADHAAARDFVDRSFHSTRLPRALLAWGLAERFGTPYVARLLDAVEPHHLLRAEELQQLRVPVHLLWGTGDQLLPAGHFEWWARHLPPGSSVERVPRAGHAPYLERAGAVARSIRAALAELPGGAGVG